MSDNIRRVPNLTQLARRLRTRLPGRGPGLAAYWEERAPGLIETYDAPETWDEKRWLSAGVEDEIVPDLLREAEARSVLVIGCGSGRQFGFLAPHGFELAGFDVAPTMIEECRRRFPSVPTHVGGVVGAEQHSTPADAVVSSAVLAHIPPTEIDAAIDSIRTLGRRIVILREKTRFEEDSFYQWAHDYSALFEGWRCVHRHVTDEGDTFTAELMAWCPPN